MKKNQKLAFSIVFLLASMSLLAYAAVPLYKIFCQVTGFAGTTQISETYYHKQKGTRDIIVRFDANVSPDLDWKFEANQAKVTVKPGENTLVFYTAKNNSSEDVIGTATYNVTPDGAGIYFNKIQCFCFEEQLLKAGQEMQMPVSFFIDPSLEKDPDLKNLGQITLSYSFFKVEK